MVVHALWCTRVRGEQRPPNAFFTGDPGVLYGLSLPVDQAEYCVLYLE